MLIRILFVCYENICRSPMAEGVFRYLLNMRGVDELFEIVSAGTVCYQSGSCPDPRAVRAAARSGIDITGIRAQCIHDLELAGFDHVFAMDHENYRDILDTLDGSDRPGVHLMTAFARRNAGSEIDDPYYGPEEGFDRTILTLIESSEGILSSLLSEYGIVDAVDAASRLSEPIKDDRHGSPE